MKAFFVLLIFMACVGCQSVAKKPTLKIVPMKQNISIHVEKVSNHYSLKIKWSKFEGEIEEVLAAPIITGKTNLWLNVSANMAPKYLNSKIRYLIDGETVEINSLPGVNLTSKIIPIDEQSVHVKGIFSSAMLDKGGELFQLTLPFDLNCKLGETKILYEKEIKLEPVK